MKSCEYKVKSKSGGVVLSVMKEILSDASEAYSVIVEDAHNNTKYEIVVENYDSVVAIVDCLEVHALCGNIVN